MALSALLWLLTAAAWCRKVAELDPLPFDRYGRTVALVRVGDTVVKEGLIRQGPASVFARC